MIKSKAVMAAALVILGASTVAAMAQPYGGRYDDRRYERRYYDYGADCRDERDQRGTAGAIIGAIAGGALGAGISQGNAGAAIGGVILGGLAGNAIGRDIDCGDRRYAMRAYDDGFNGRIGQRYSWRGQGNNYGYMVPIRSYRDRGYECREFRTTTYRHGQRLVREGRACRQNDGRWHMR